MIERNRETTHGQKKGRRTPFTLKQFWTNKPNWGPRLLLGKDKYENLRLLDYLGSTIILQIVELSYFLFTVISFIFA